MHSFVALLEALEAFDGRLAAIVSRTEVEERLGDRVELLGMQPWTRRLRDAATAETITADATPPSSDAMGDTLPDDAIVTEYATNGRWHRVVEDAARRSEPFREELVGYIDALVAEREPVSFLARRWRQLAGSFRRVDQPRVVAATQLDAVPRLALAAATTEVEIPTRSTRLGVLGDVAAEARLVCTPREATLLVYAEPGAIASVEFGETRVVSPDEHGDWVAKTPVRHGETRIHVVATSGAEFRADVMLTHAVDE
jgi:hypothetical protein